MLLSVGEQGVHRFGLGNVQLVEPGGAARLGDGVHDGRAALLIAAADHHARALGPEHLRDARADAAGGTGDDGDFVLQTIHGFPLSTQ